MAEVTWDGGWAADARRKSRSWQRLSASERLEWLDDALEFAASVGALSAERGHRAEAVGHWIVCETIASIGRLRPLDEQEEEHQRLTLDLLRSTEDVFRRVAPVTPAPHLVSYVVPVDRASQSLFLVDHRRAGRWIPPGGHVEPHESPVAAAVREAEEELGVRRAGTPVSPDPAFLTWATTRGANPHVDVSLWYEMPATVKDVFAWDRREFTDARWWGTGEVLAAPAGACDPHLVRFVVKTFG